MPSRSSWSFYFHLRLIFILMLLLFGFWAVSRRLGDVESWLVFPGWLAGSRAGTRPQGGGEGATGKHVEKRPWRRESYLSAFDHQADSRFALGVAKKRSLDDIVAPYYRAWAERNVSDG
ncbi:hypothetical protein RRG08_050903 [Elysia crispata]|uniref:Uncharacterized protein n=1 Tax=Elysia crispata TaxID=231223 RepID=A0AAE0ZSE6_9GAST|nr:hypothetical protein RRG08_050903 [Elysia crispata]